MDNSKLMRKKKPSWLKIKISPNKNFFTTRKLIEDSNLNTVCLSAQCPNKGECWANGTATFMILGDTCTRNCRFCAVNKGTPDKIEKEEPQKIAEAVSKLKLKYAVVTSVTRDDLLDGGASHFAEVITKIKEVNKNCFVEVLIPDFNANMDSLQIVLDAKPDVLNHNLETIPRLYNTARQMANYKNSLEVLKYSKENGFVTKSGIMVGIGETIEEIKLLMSDLRKINCDILTIGQYLQPTSSQLAVERFVTPEEFEYFKNYAHEIGFKHVESGPLVRSSYHAEKQIKLIKK